MKISVRRAAAMARKDLLHIIREPRNLFLVTAAPAFLLVLLANVFSFGVAQFDLAVLDLDGTQLSRRYVASLTSDEDWILGDSEHHFSVYTEKDSLAINGIFGCASSWSQREFKRPG